MNELLESLYSQPGRDHEVSLLDHLRMRQAKPLRLAVMGCTGSIGKSTIDIVRANPDRLRVVALAAGSNEAELMKMARDLGVTRTALAKSTTSMPSGVGALRALAAEEDVDIVVNAVVGAAGLEVTLGALDGGNDIALANKESLVMAGELVMRRAAERKVAIRPIDSEHSSLVSCMRGRTGREIRRVYLTASGGPFRGRAKGTFDNVTVEEALNHPTWSMGPKITIDSATLMNKGLEIIEAHFLFELPASKIEVIVHPQSIIHAMVQHSDGSVVAELAPPDMRLPIQRALLPGGNFQSPLDLTRLGALTFEQPDHAAFPLILVACEALARGGTAPAVVNAANEIAVGAFLEKKISFGAISGIIQRTIAAHTPHPVETEADVYDADAWARKEAGSLIAG
ncbi:MAG: 1-deoxy-D-xylulose-5-phosphate reductoisomerase [Candidatus Hydrogenedentota bacterium]